MCLCNIHNDVAIQQVLGLLIWYFLAKEYLSIKGHLAKTASLVLLWERLQKWERDFVLKVFVSTNV